MTNINFKSVVIIGVGLIGSSIARAIKEKKVSKSIYGIDINEENIKKCLNLKIISKGEKNLIDLKEQTELIIICSPLGTYKEIFLQLEQYLKQDTLVTDVGSTKMSTINDFEGLKNNHHIKFVPCHPIAGLEKSGPEFGLVDLFDNRFCILTPINKEDKFIEIIKSFWNIIGMKIEIMDSDHHDRVLAMTSHIPQLIAYSIVATATELETHIKDEVVKYSAAGFRDFTRLAGSDPIMWRDVYVLNKEAVLEMLGRFTEDLSTLQKAIRNNDIAFLEKTFRSTREMRKIIEDLGQAGSFDPTENLKK